MRYLCTKIKTTLVTLVLLFVFSSAMAQQWQNITPTEYPYVFGFSFINGEQGWFRAYKDLSSNEPERLLFTPDGGQTFDQRYTFDEVAGFMSFQMVDSLVGYGLVNKYNNFFWHTVDGGYSWEDITDTAFMNQNGEIQYGSCIFFQNRDTGFIGGHNAIYKTTDGCQNWVKCNIPEIIDTVISNNNFRISNIFFVDSKYGWAACTWLTDFGFGMKTTNGGLDWEICTPTSLTNMLDVDAHDSLSVGMVGNNWFETSISLTENNFITLSYLYTAWDFDLIANSISYQNDSIIWIVGQPGYLKRSIDRGATFTTFFPNDILATNTTIYKVRFYENIGYAVGEHNGNENRFLLKFVDTINTNIQKPRIKNNRISISPNPLLVSCNVKIFLEKSELISFEIFSSNGMRIYQSVKFLNIGNSEISFDVGNLETGIYLLITKTSNWVQANKFIKLPN